MKKRIKQIVKCVLRYEKIRFKIILWRDSLSHVYFNRIISHFPSHTIRLLLLRVAGANISKNVAIHSGSEFWLPKRLEIGNGSVVGFDCLLDAREGLVIGKNVCLASQVMIWSLQHDYNSSTFEGVGGKVEIGDYSWICSRSIILPNVKIAEGTVVAAGAVVTKDTEPYSVVGGIPAKKIRDRDRSHKYDYIPSKYKLHIV